MALAMNDDLAADLAAMTAGLDLGPGRRRVAVAMSGGVDSSLAAAVVARAGHEAVGLTLQLYDHGAAGAKPGACCAGADIGDARRIAHGLGIAHYVLDYEERFRRAVIDDFVDGYANGQTPLPCVRCNQRIKFADLLDTARDLGAEALVTGHYVVRRPGPAGPTLHRAAEAARDQSYFLFATTPAQLAALRFPLGGIAKARARALARALGLCVADKPDSQDICFVPQGRYSELVARLRPDAARPGDIVDTDGRLLGRHQGVAGYTVGQRRGLGLAAGEPLYVVRIEPARRRLVVGPRAALATRGVRLTGVNWLGERALGEAAGSGLDLWVKIRSTSEPAPARLTVAGGVAEVELLQGEMGVAPGQACAFYGGEGAFARVLGGGWIAAARAAADADWRAGTLAPVPA
jgi:tRNA-specific 2-thiouridylase